MPSFREIGAGDPEGGAPFVEADPAHPDKLVGFDVEIADLIARGLGRTPRFVLVTFDSMTAVSTPPTRSSRRYLLLVVTCAVPEPAVLGMS